MKRFVQIYNGKAHWIFEAEEMPEFSADIVLKDITNVALQPLEGWDYDSNTDTFNIPVTTQPTPDDVKQAKTSLHKLRHFIKMFAYKQ